MAEFKSIPDSSSGSQNNIYCKLKEDASSTPSQKGCLLFKPFWIPLVCGMLFMVLLITVSVSFKQQFSKLTELENTVANLTSSVALLTSNQQDTNDRFVEMFGDLKADLEIRITNLTKRKPVLSCKPGWQLYLSSCYLFSSTALDWVKARSSCSAQGALLLILGQDASEWYFIVTRVSKSKSHWIGLTDQTTGQWRWVDGSPYIMDKSQWEPGEPNNLSGEDCAELTSSGKLNDGLCSRSFQFICKAPANEN
ncbi:C-type lectin domain family 10 member A isoform X1 [Paramisgurnus dabryanus]|uniref:C-type lectin domain family 10 member A isoform X1 n=1 Tax=Paramisgurnus dabryanus TaxID=90735 RepID=UPI0031F424B9